MTRSSGFSIPLLLAAGALILAACGGGSDAESSPSSESVEATDAPTTDAPDAAPTTEPSDALDDPRCGVVVDPDDDIDEFEPISCDEPHDAEFAGMIVSSSDEAFDDDSGLNIELDGLCAPSVRDLTGESLESFGVDVGVVRGEREGGDGSEFEVECWALTATADVLVGSMDAVGFRGALISDVRVLATDVDAGSCVRFSETGFDLVYEADCSDDGAEQFVAVVEVSANEYPGKDALLDQGYELCDAAMADADFDLISDLSGLVYPLEDGWTSLNQRQIICLLSQPEPGDEVAQIASADQPCARSSDDGYLQIDCDEPHTAEFAGAVAPPVDVLPDDAVEASTLLFAACQASVEDLIGRDPIQPGIRIGFSITGSLGEAIDGDVLCFADTKVDDGLVGSIADIGLEAALTKLVVSDQTPGDCLLIDDENNYDLGDAADCTAPDALMFLGNLQFDDGPYPGIDALRDTRAVICGDLLTSSGLAADLATVSGVFPSESQWNLGNRNVACDASPL